MWSKRECEKYCAFICLKNIMLCDIKDIYTLMCFLYKTFNISELTVHFYNNPLCVWVATFSSQNEW